MIVSLLLIFINPSKGEVHQFEYIVSRKDFHLAQQVGYPEIKTARMFNTQKLC
jgi:hypothetical protein